MRARRPIRRTAAVWVLGLSILPALAQDRDQGGLRFGLDLDQRLEYTGNLGLEIPREAPTALATTRLSFRLEDATPSSRFALSAGAALKLLDGPTGSDALIDEPSLKLSYNRAAANASFGIAASYLRSEVDFLRPIDDFLNDEGEIELPEDLADLEGSGTRTRYGVDLEAEVGTAAPLGFALSAGASGISYADVTDPGLFDIRRARVGATAILRFSETTEAHMELGYDRYEAEDAAATLRETRTVEVGIDQTLSARTRLNASLGYAIIDTEEFGASTRIDGFNGRLAVAYQMPNGDLTADATADTTQDGTRVGFSVGRSIELPSGALSVMLGVTRPEGGEWAPVGDLSWSRNLPDGRITARLSRSVSTTNDDEEALTTLIALGYDRQINAVSDFGFKLSYAAIDQTGTDPSVSRASLSATYSRALTADWNMSFGLAYQLRDEAGAGQASSETVFLGLSRRFDWRP